MAPTDVPVIKEYSARLILPSNTKLTVTCEDKARLQRRIQSLLQQESQEDHGQQGSTRFENINPMTILVFHSTFLDGKQPVGKISEYTTPENMSVREQAESFVHVRRAA